MVESNSDNGIERKKVGEMTGVLFTMYKFVQIIQYNGTLIISSTFIS